MIQEDFCFEIRFRNKFMKAKNMKKKKNLLNFSSLLKPNVHLEKFIKQNLIFCNSEVLFSYHGCGTD